MSKTKITIDPTGTKYYSVSNIGLHREDGPAVELADGTKEWWLDGKKVDQLVFWVTTKERMKNLLD